MEALVDPRNLLTALVAILTFATLFTLLGSFVGGAKLEDRMKSVADRKEELRRRSRQNIAQQSASTLRREDGGFKKRVVERLNLSKLLEDPKVVDSLAQAGFRGPRPLTTFYFFRFTMPFVMAALVAFYLFVVNDFGLPGMVRVAAVVRPSFVLVRGRRRSLVCVGLRCLRLRPRGSRSVRRLGPSCPVRRGARALCRRRARSFRPSLCPSSHRPGVGLR